MNGREPWNRGYPPLLWTPTPGQREPFPADEGDGPLPLLLLLVVLALAYVLFMA